MRIISKFKDYYDGIASIGGHDKTIIYERHTEEQYKVNLPFQRFHHSIPGIEKANYVYVIFCGKLYFSREEGGLLWDEKEKIYVNIPYSYKWNDFSFIEKAKRRSLWNNNIRSFKDQFSRDFTEVNLEYKSPILLYVVSSDWHNDNKLVINPRLDNYKFGSAINPFEAYQLLEGFVDTHFTRTIDNVIIDPKYRFEMKGFSNKTSFRKESTKKK
jgi:hypothetical protein